VKAVLLNLLEYHWVEDLDDALILLSRTGTTTVPLAGGTYLLAMDDERIQAVVDLRDLDLAYMREDARGVHIGAMTTLQAIADSSLLADLAAGLLARAAQVSSPSQLIRNSATLGGTLAIGAASQADLLTALAAIEAEALLRSGSKSQIDLGAGSSDRPGLALSGVTFKGKHERRLPTTSLIQERRTNELILEVTIPRLGFGYGASLQRAGRTPTDTALLNAAAVVEVTEGIYSHVRLALGGVRMEPLRLRAVEQQLEGQSAMNADSNTINTQLLVSALQAGLEDFQPPPDMRASSSYRHTAVINLAFRALEDAVTISRWRRMVSSQERQ
jgi:CO/xanthine dehydrogenase FAD-binding subunit